MLLFPPLATVYTNVEPLGPTLRLPDGTPLRRAVCRLFGHAFSSPPFGCPKRAPVYLRRKVVCTRCGALALTAGRPS